MIARLMLLPVIALGAVAAAPPLEADSESATQAERRLRACLSTNASGHATLEAAILHARAACKPQINDLRDVRIIAATSGLEPDAARVAAQRVTRDLNNEIAHAIANFSGLSASHAHH